NTSACAEKSALITTIGTVYGKYLRVRGEEGSCEKRNPEIEEIPPRARRRVSYTDAALRTLGNTSACAEKSSAGQT
ncbi:hypothetical protein, partial [Corynebacterium sp. HMSC077D03]|uniref:hypothetical protein n=1 Tax=Corynebacterium sp. HMSC077D03 TaxID=1739392 RepID=UPI001AEFED8C